MFFEVGVRATAGGSDWRRREGRQGGGRAASRGVVPGDRGVVTSRPRGTAARAAGRGRPPPSSTCPRWRAAEGAAGGTSGGSPTTTSSTRGRAGLTTPARPGELVDRARSRPRDERRPRSTVDLPGSPTSSPAKCMSVSTPDTPPTSPPVLRSRGTVRSGTGRGTRASNG